MYTNRKDQLQGVQLKMHYCGQCGADVAQDIYCRRCGAKVEEPSLGDRRFDFRRGGPDGGGIASSFTENELAALAYLTPIPAVLLLLHDPYRRNYLLRFHSFQCLLLTATAIGLIFIAAYMAMLQILGGVLMAALELGLAAMWIYAPIMAWQGRDAKLPVIGPIAVRFAERP